MTKQLVIFDIDGTLADNEHRVHHLHKTPKDWDAFFADQHLDTLNEDVAHVYRMYRMDQQHIPNTHIAILTGRGEEHREVTQGWLAEHHLYYQKLAMRPAGDRTDDHVIKLNVIKAWQAEGYEIIGFYEDRKRIADAARAHGITVFHVAEGNF